MHQVRCPHCNAVFEVWPQTPSATIPCENCLKPVKLDSADTQIQGSGPKATPLTGASDTHLQKRIAPKKTPVAPMSTFGPDALPWGGAVARSPAYRHEMQRFSERSLPSLANVKVRPLPEAVPDEVAELGRPLASFHVARESWLVWMFCGLGSILTGLWFLFTAVCVAMQLGGYSDAFGLVAMVLMGIPLVVLGVWYLVRKRPEPRQALWICPEGIVWEKRRAYGFCKWHEIEDFEMSGAGVSLVIWLTPVQGTNFIFRHGQGSSLQPIADYVERRASGALLPIMLKRILDGEALRFDQLSMDRNGVYVGDDFCPWDEVTDMRAEATTFYVDHVGGTGRFRLHARNVAFPMVVQAISRILTEEQLPS